MLVGRLPYDPMPANTMYEQIKTKKLFNGDKLHQKNAPQLSKETISTLKKMLQIRAEERISWRDLLQEPILDDGPYEELPGDFQINKTVRNAEINKKIQCELYNIDQENEKLYNELEKQSEIGSGNKKGPEIQKLTAKEV